MTATEKIAQRITDGIRDFVTRSLQSRDARITELEQRMSRIEATEQSRTFADSYKGSFSPNTGYARGDWVNHRGAVWLCMKSTSEPPGSTDKWRLILKSAR